MTRRTPFVTLRVAVIPYGHLIWQLLWPFRRAQGYPGPG